MPDIWYTGEASNVTQTEYKSLVDGAYSWHNGTDQFVLTLKPNLRADTVELELQKQGVVRADVETAINDLQTAIEGLAIDLPVDDENFSWA